MNKKISWMLLAALLLTGCVVQSLNRFYTDDLKVELNEIYGNWRLIKGLGTKDDYSKENIKPWKLSKSEILTHDEKGRAAIFEATYFNIADTHFIDLSSGLPKDINEFWGFTAAPMHVLVKLEIKKGELILYPLNYYWLKERIEKNDPDLKYIKAAHDNDVPNDVPIFTMTGEEWVRYLKHNLKEKDMFSEEHRIILQRINNQR